MTHPETEKKDKVVVKEHSVIDEVFAQTKSTLGYIAVTLVLITFYSLAGKRR